MLKCILMFEWAVQFFSFIMFLWHFFSFSSIFSFVNDSYDFWMGCKMDKNTQTNILKNTKIKDDVWVQPVFFIKLACN